jgi:hypothetical protein
MFWQATPQELLAALDFMARQNGRLTTAEVASLRRKLDGT